MLKFSVKDFSSNISNTRDSVSSGYPNTEKRVEKYDTQRSIFNEIRGVWIADETLARIELGAIYAKVDVYDIPIPHSKALQKYFFS